ncbi:MAG: AMP-binding protein [Bernardetiaceae bacterium]
MHAHKLPTEVKEWLQQLKAQNPSYKETLDEAFQIWEELTLHLSGYDFSVHQSVFADVFATHPFPVVWSPNQDLIEKTNIYQWMQAAGKASYEDFYRWSITEREAFWQMAVDQLGVVFEDAPSRILDLENGAEHPVWLSGATMNLVDTIFSGVDPQQTAILSGSEADPTPVATTYADLQALTQKAAKGFEQMGLRAGDSVVLYLPLSLEATAAYLGLLQAGIRAVLVADSFSPAEIQRRLEVIPCKAILTFSTYTYGGRVLDFYAKIKAVADAPPAIVIHPDDTPTLRPGDLLWEDFLAEGDFETVYQPADAITTILFSSGTTKAPKAIPWTQLTPLKCATDAHLHHDVHSEDVVTWTTSMGWMMGPWTLFAGLLNKATTALFYGSGATEAFRDFAVAARVSVLGTIPSLVKVWRSRKLLEGADLPVRLFSSTGEPSNAEDYLYLMSLKSYQTPIVEYCGGTEIGGGYLTGSLLQPASPATFTTPALGMGVYFMDDNHQPVQAGQTGQVFLVPPSMGLSQSLLNRDHHEEYFKGIQPGPKGETLRKHGDAHDVMKRRFYHKDYVFYKSHGRVDDAMNIGGIKVSALEIEEVALQHPLVGQTAAVAVQEKDGPEILVLFIVPKAPLPDTFGKELQKMISQELNPLFRIGDIRTVDALPVTASNKVMRRSLRDQYLNEKA